MAGSNQHSLIFTTYFTQFEIICYPSDVGATLNNVLPSYPEECYLRP